MKKLGIIGFLVEKIFYLLKYFPPQLFVEERAKHQNRLQNLSEKEKHRAIDKRMQKTEIVIILYILFYIFSISFMSLILRHSFLKYSVLALVTLRLIDIIQVNVNILLFDSLRINTSKIKPFIYSSVRSIILVLFNFFEIALLFGFYYTLINYGSLNSKAPILISDKFYFSFITQLTIGYGDIAPEGFYKLLAVIQGLIGYFFTILIISRFLVLLPDIKSSREDVS